MLEGGGAGEAAVSGDGALDAWRAKHGAAAGRAPSAASLEAWRERLTARETAVIEGICAEGMARWGYGAPETGRAGRLSALAAAGAARGLHAAERRLRGR